MSTPKKRSRIATKLLWLSAVVLVVPWLGIESLHTMKRFLIEGQQQAQLQVAEGIAAILSRDPLLRSSLSIDNSSPQSGETIVLYSSEANHLVDGYGDEWRTLDRFSQVYGAAEGEGFRMNLAQRGNSVFGWLSVQDVTPRVFRPGSNPLKNTDHVRLTFESAAGETFSMALLFEGNGRANAYPVSPGNSRVDLNSPDRRFKAEVLLQPKGYELEIRFPASLITESRRFGLTQVNAGEPGEPPRITSTFDRKAGRGINSVSMRSRDLETLLSEFTEEGARLWIIDSNRHVKALVGQLQPDKEGTYAEYRSPWWRSAFHGLTGIVVGITPGTFQDFDAVTVQSRNDGVYQQALSTGSSSVGVRKSLDGKAEIITVAVPLGNEESPLGVLLQEKSTQNLLLLQRQSLEKLMLITVAAMALVTLALLLFALWLTLRIRGLGVEVSAAVDSYGRLKTGKSLNIPSRGDEIDDVALRINGMLSRLDQYQSFLKTIPRVLRHEINNPLNTIATSLDRLRADAHQQESLNSYMESADRGLERINHVINRVTEAASLEQAMQEGDKEPLDLASLVDTYLSHQARGRVGSGAVAWQKPPQPMMILGCGDYLELLLDKLLDNARDHSCNYKGTGAPITVSLLKQGEFAVVSVENKGPLVEESDLANLFNFMFSRRHTGGEHLGLGLYIAQLITEFHGGTLDVKNLSDGSGVAFRLRISLDEYG